MMDASRLGFDPLIPWIALFVLAGGAFALWGAYVVYRGKAWLFRALALTLLTLALANPLWIEEQREPLKDVVAVIMDRSESMNFRGRTETAQAAYDALRRDLEADENLELRIAETDPGADGTDMYIALQSALSDVPRDRIAGAVMIATTTEAGTMAPMVIAAAATRRGGLRSAATVAIHRGDRRAAAIAETSHAIAWTTGGEVTDPAIGVGSALRSSTNSGV
jgi:hypothetical protein